MKPQLNSGPSVGDFERVSVVHKTTCSCISALNLLRAGLYLRSEAQAFQGFACCGLGGNVR
jgi:hypothetical protein